MAGIIHKIEEKLGMGGHKEGVKKPEHSGDHKADHGYGGDHKADHGYGGDHKKSDHGHSGEHKEGMVEKIKDKIHGEGGHEKKDGEKKKKKDKKKKEHGHEHGHSSSSDSDSD